MKWCKEEECKGAWVRDPGRGNCVQPFTSMQMIRKGPSGGSERNKGSDIRGGHRPGHRPRRSLDFKMNHGKLCPSCKLLFLFETLSQFGMGIRLPLGAECENCICSEVHGLRNLYS